MQGTLQLSNGPIVSVALAHQQGFDLKLIGPTLDDKRTAPGQTASVVRRMDLSNRSPTSKASASA